MRSLRGCRSPYILMNCQCQRRYRRTEDVFVVTADGSRTAGEPERPDGNAGDDRGVPLGPRARVPGTAGAVAADPYDLESGGRVCEPARADVPEVKRLQSVKRMCAIRSIDMLMLGHIENDFKVSKTETDESRKVQKTHREGVRMNETAIRRENHIKNKLQKNAELKK